ncbi:ATP-binding cassette domain-containing protein, partial [Lacticaseibacillus paracasei]
LTNYSGSIHVDDLELNSLPASMLNAKIELVDQKSYIFNESVQENITLGNPKASNTLNKIVEFLGINTFTSLSTNIHEHGSNLSGG